MGAVGHKEVLEMTHKMWLVGVTALMHHKQKNVAVK